MRIAFFSEAVTLAHVARPHVLAQALARRGHEVTVARHPRFDHLFPDASYRTRRLDTIPSQAFTQALAKGHPIYEPGVLRTYVAHDIRVIEDLRPDLVVGDFRLSLAVSAPICGVQHLAIANAYWSPYAKTPFPVPDIPMTGLLGVRAAKLVFDAARPLAFALHAWPLNRVRREWGLTGLGSDLRHTYTHADHTWYADLPELVPTFGAPRHHRHIGPILWSPAIALPAWWKDVPHRVPVVYVNLGSSGPPRLLSVVLQALASLPVTVIAATAGHEPPRHVPANAFVADYLPGDAAAERARIVVCNGGSPSTQQAFAAGAAVIGIASNLDQYANMHFVQQAGAGLLVRSGEATAGRLREAVLSVLGQPSFAASACAIRVLTERCDTLTGFADRVDALLS